MSVWFECTLSVGYYAILFFSIPVGPFLVFLEYTFPIKQHETR